VKEFLLKKGVQFIEKNVSKDPGVIDELKKLGVMTTPVTLINGEMVIGFDEQKLNKLIIEIGTR
jgi:glutaredoxin